MPKKPEPNDLEVTGTQVFEGEVVKPPKLDPDNPIQEGATVKVYEFPAIEEVNIDPEDFTVNPLHAIARQKDIDNRKHTEPMKCIDTIQSNIADIENLHVNNLDKVSKVRRLASPHFQNIEREIARLKSILEVKE